MDKNLTRVLNDTYDEKYTRTIAVFAKSKVGMSPTTFEAYKDPAGTEKFTEEEFTELVNSGIILSILEGPGVYFPTSVFRPLVKPGQTSAPHVRFIKSMVLTENADPTLVECDLAAVQPRMH